MTCKLEWQVIFTDEKKFNLYGPDGYAYYFHDLRKEEMYLSRRHSDLGSIMVWGSICYKGVLELVMLEENVWGWLARKLYAAGRQFDKEALKAALMKEWSAIPQQYMQSLYHSMPSRLFVIIKNNGKNTKY
ncbi:unnamed protein product [Euphydryas editha]|uniref:Transposable element Tc3 transposase n=1 Tax=Euphydryas editha TaxID=104508 RepID=A0AAU9TQ25_EUPED|nr:unnamed protein product [Euphydryas editha]